MYYVMLDLGVGNSCFPPLFMKDVYCHQLTVFSKSSSTQGKCVQLCKLFFLRPFTSTGSGYKITGQRSVYLIKFVLDFFRYSSEQVTLR